MKNSLELFTSKELIEELFNRSTFVGVLITSNEEHRYDFQVHNSYSAYSTVPLDQISNLLEYTVNQIKTN